jgi:mono/diheme cytochrome c family protein
MKHARTTFFQAVVNGFGIVAFGLLLNSGVAKADDTELETDVFSIARGGQYYDKWWAVIDADEPEGTHPAYTAEGKKKGSSTWRCKECHGWDYKGKDGAYGKGSHYSGIKGIDGKAGADVEEIAKIIRGEPHNFTTQLLPDKAVERLALFVSAGQIDMDQYIDRETKKAKGDPKKGARIYQTVCSNCHGFDGKEINFKDEKKPEYIGTVASANPWETLHKTRHGQPGQVMPALIALNTQDLVDIVAYAQTLPTK